MNPTVIVFAKRPTPGEVKTRLAASIGAAAAAQAYSALLGGVLDRLSSPECAWKLALAVTPDETVAQPELWPRPVTLRPQGSGSLGARLERALATAGEGARAAVVGSDVPGLGPEHVTALLAAVERADLALGPAPDGGFWGVAASRPLPTGALEAVRWSTAHAREDTLSAAERAGLSVAVIDLWLEDVDDLASYQRWKCGR